MQIIPWLIEPQTTDCLKNGAKHCRPSALCYRREPSESGAWAGQPRPPAPRGPSPAGTASWDEYSQLSASIQRFQIQFLWFLNQFLGHQWKKGSNSDVSKNGSSGRLETPQISTPWEEAFLKALEPLHFCTLSVENEITPFLAWKRFSSYITPGPRSAGGQLVIVQSGGGWPARGRRKERQERTGPKQSLKSSI